MSAARACAECGEPIVRDTSPGVWLHDDDALGDRAYDLDEDHTARLDVEAPTWIEVYDVCDGALGETFDFQGDVGGASAAERAEAKAAALRDELTAIQGELGPWAVYVLPHYCAAGSDCEPDPRQRIERDESGECACASWLTDHHPLYSYDGKGDE